MLDQNQQTNAEPGAGDAKANDAGTEAGSSTKTDANANAIANEQASTWDIFDEAYHKVMPTLPPTLEKVAEGLSEKQCNVLSVLTTGETIPEAAGQVGVDRGTVYRWIRSDPQFRAAYNAWLLEQREGCRISLERTAALAVAKLNQSVERDGNLAFKVAKEMGLFKPATTLAVDPKRARHEIIVEQWEDESKLDRRIAEQVAGKKRRRELEVEIEDELSFAVEYSEAPRVAQKAINNKIDKFFFGGCLHGK